MNKSGLYKILPIATKILIENKIKQHPYLTPSEIIIFKEVEIFNEIADPEYAYEYKKIEPDKWEFNDRFGNTLGVEFDPSSKYFESFYVVKDTSGNFVKLYDYEMNKNYIDPTSFQGGSDEHRSDTICKILLDEILPKYLLNIKPSLIKLHPLNKYRYEIFRKCAEVCKEKYPNLEIENKGKEIYLINK